MLHLNTETDTVSETPCSLKILGKGKAIPVTGLDFPRNIIIVGARGSVVG
jgi:hypothetical protein